jgi:hypothetical protein
MAAMADAAQSSGGLITPPKPPLGHFRGTGGFVGSGQDPLVPSQESAGCVDRSDWQWIRSSALPWLFKQGRPR